jgi:Spy/CpxP family protein refolding chaperone
MAGELELSLEQREALRALVDAHWNGGLHEAADVERAARRALRLQIHDPAATEEQLRATAQKLTDAVAEVAVLRHRVFVEVRGLLTPEQQEKLARLEAEREARGARRHRGFDARMGTGDKTDS